jgi:hypothetical protein
VSGGNDDVRAAAASLVHDAILHTDLADNESQHHQSSANMLLKAADDDQGLSVYPEVGKLIIFFTCGDDGDVDPMSWHGASSVDWQRREESVMVVESLEESLKQRDDIQHVHDQVDSGGKWTLQIFKELPLGVARETFIKEKRDRLRGMLNK